MMSRFMSFGVTHGILPSQNAVLSLLGVPPPSTRPSLLTDDHAHPLGNGNGTSSNEGACTRALFVGHQAELQAEWRFDQHLSLTADYAHFFAGRFLKETGPGRDVDYASGWVTYRF
jgi:hypothetical protein